MSVKRGDTRRSLLADIRGVAGLAAPLALTQLGQVGMITTDVLMVGRLGPIELAAIALGQSSEHLCLLFLVGVATASASMIGQSFGARQPRQMRRAIRQAIWVVAAISVPLMLLLWNIAPILRLLDQDPVLIPLTEDYVRTVLWAMPTMAGMIVLRSFVSVFNRARIVLLVTLAALPLNALLDNLLIFGHWGFPAWELAGAGIATSLVSLAMFLVVAVICARERPFRRYAIWHRFWRPDWPTFWATMRIGLPIGLTLVMEVGLFVSGIYITGTIDPLQVAGTQIALQLTTITFMVPLGIGQAATTRIAMASGRGMQSRVRREGLIAAGLGLAFMGSMAWVFWFANEFLAEFFLDPDDTMALAALGFGALYLRIASVFQLFDGLQVIAISALRGLNDTRVPLLLALVAYWLIGFSTCWLLAFWLGFEGLGVWIGWAIALASASVLLTWRFLLLSRP